MTRRRMNMTTNKDRNTLNDPDIESIKINYNTPFMMVVLRAEIHTFIAKSEHLYYTHDEAKNADTIFIHLDSAVDEIKLPMVVIEYTRGIYYTFIQFKEYRGMYKGYIIGKYDQLLHILKQYELKSDVKENHYEN